MIIHTGAQLFIQMYVSYYETFGRVYVMFNIQAYATFWWSHWYDQVTGTRHSMVEFPLYSRYRYNITIVIVTYQHISILAPHTFLVRFHCVVKIIPTEQFWLESIPAYQFLFESIPEEWVFSIFFHVRWSLTDSILLNFLKLDKKVFMYGLEIWI